MNGQRVLRLEPATSSVGGIFAPNVIGGFSGNAVSPVIIGGTVAGGGLMVAPNRVAAGFGTIGGGNGNPASGTEATIGGGSGNTASNTRATVGGGINNTANGFHATVAGGLGNTASGDYATVGAGANNTASGAYATVIGGTGNTASGIGSVALGQDVTASKDGCFIFGGGDYPSATGCGAAKQAVWRTFGGFVIYTSDAGGVQIGSGGGSWASFSDRNAKTHLEPVDPETVLAQVVSLPVATWNYTSQDAAIRHMGPMAQDFQAAFGLGEDDTHITAVDAEGVALAAIQGLWYRDQAQAVQLTAQAEQLAAQQARIDQLEAQNAALEARLAAIEAALPAAPSR